MMWQIYSPSFSEENTIICSFISTYYPISVSESHHTSQDVSSATPLKPSVILFNMHSRDGDIVI